MRNRKILIMYELTKIKRAKIEKEVLELADDEDLCQRFGEYFIYRDNIDASKACLPPNQSFCNSWSV